MPLTNDLWGSAVSPSRRSPVYLSAAAALDEPVRQYAGAFLDRQSRFAVRRLKRYGDFIYGVPVAVLWVDNDWDWDDVWCCV